MCEQENDYDLVKNCIRPSYFVISLKLHTVNGESVGLCPPGLGLIGELGLGLRLGLGWAVVLSEKRSQETFQKSD
jgi:hypothetical protein